MPNKAISFDGSNDYVSFGNVLNISAGQDFTIELWYKGAEPGWGGLLTKRNNGDSNVGYDTMISNVQFGAFGRQGSVAFSWGTIPVNDGDWHHLLFVFDRSGNLEFYVDLKSAGSVSISAYAADAITNTLSLMLGRDYNGNCVIGHIDEVVFYTKALSESERSATFNDGNGLYHAPGDSIAAIWHFDDDALDYSGNGYHGTVYGAGYVDGIVAAPPIAPSDLEATAVSSEEIDLAWEDNSSDETGFKIERKEGVGGTYAEIDTVGAGDVVGIGTTWTQAMVGCLFNRRGSKTFYLIESVEDATHLTLATDYEGPGESSADYEIITDYTDNLTLCELILGDADASQVLKYNFRKIDEKLRRDVSIRIPGTLAAATEQGGVWFARAPGKIKGVSVHRKTPGAGGSTIVDINIDGVSIFTTRPTIAFDDADGRDRGDINTAANSFLAGSKITVDIDTVESGTPADLSVDTLLGA